MPHPPRAPVPPDPPMVPIAVTGTVLWAVAAAVLFGAGAPTRWLEICVAGFLLGLPGIAVMVGHDRRRARRAVRAGHESQPGGPPDPPGG